VPSSIPGWVHSDVASGVGSPDDFGSLNPDELAAGPEHLTPVELWNLAIILQRACGRATGGRREARRKYFCLAGQIFNAEATLRGLPTPPPSASYGALKHDPDYGSV
jgi:hypothetical protein